MGNCLRSAYRRVVGARYDRKKKGDALEINKGIETCKGQVHTLGDDARMIQRRIDVSHTTITLKLRQRDRGGALLEMKTMKIHQAQYHDTQNKLIALISLQTKLETLWQNRNMQEAFVDFVDTTKHVTDNGKLTQVIDDQVEEVENQNQTLHALQETMNNLFQHTGVADLNINDWDLEDELDQWMTEEDIDTSVNKSDQAIKSDQAHTMHAKNTSATRSIAAEPKKHAPSFDPSDLLTLGNEPMVLASELEQEREPLLT